MQLSPEQQEKVNAEIRRLSLDIALVRYDYIEAKQQKKPLNVISKLCLQYAELWQERYNLQNSNFDQLPYNIKFLIND